MRPLRQPARDPRTVARDIPGVFDALFPQLAPGVVVHLNRDATFSSQCEAVPEELIGASPLQHAMLFEIAVAAGEQILVRHSVDWNLALEIATARQRRHFDAKLPAALSDVDVQVAEHVGNNLATLLLEVAGSSKIVHSPPIPGFQWIQSGRGDFAFGSTLVEVKCTNRPFGASDYRQILMYWLLSYASSIEGGSPEWTHGVLLNPRLNVLVHVSFDRLTATIAGGRSKVDLLELFSWMIGDYSSRSVTQV